MTVNHTCTVGMPARRTFGKRASGVLNTALMATASTVWTWWQRARDRAHLNDLEPRLLDDIGMTREVRDREVRKPFWVR